ncbi:MAG TPA: hypothetical protein VMB73_24270 [Acetobacteraceae bacterium]|jgi:hypothetical protein|nr:hypothetical protein [Acetobacteraceae bacterium]
MKRLILAASLALAGYGSSPETHFYILLAVPSAHSDPGVTEGVPLQVG